MTTHLAKQDIEQKATRDKRIGRTDQFGEVLLFGSTPPRAFPDTEAEEDTFDRFGRRARGRFGD